MSGKNGGWPLRTHPNPGRASPRHASVPRPPRTGPRGGRHFSAVPGPRPRPGRWGRESWWGWRRRESAPAGRKNPGSAPPRRLAPRPGPGSLPGSTAPPPLIGPPPYPGKLGRGRVRPAEPAPAGSESRPAGGPVFPDPGKGGPGPGGHRPGAGADPGPGRARLPAAVPGTAPASGPRAGAPGGGHWPGPGPGAAGSYGIPGPGSNPGRPGADRRKKIFPPPRSLLQET